MDGHRVSVELRIETPEGLLKPNLVVQMEDRLQEDYYKGNVLQCIKDLFPVSSEVSFHVAILSARGLWHRPSSKLTPDRGISYSMRQPMTNTDNYTVIHIK